MEPIEMAREYLLVKQGLYYRPNSKGYTGVKDCAGRYLESEAILDAGVVAIHESVAPDFSEKCWPEIARDHLQSRIDAKDAAIAELVEALAAAFADPMRLINSESAMNETAAMIAKHRPDAFAKWAEGIEP